VVVVTLPSLEGRTIERVAYEMFGEWGIGSDQTDRGLLLLVAPNEREVRIEVGCGLEVPITDVAAARIIREDIVPHFRQGDYEGGVAAGTDSIVTLLERSTDRSPSCEAQSSARRLAA
jgi:uncharacterized protein